MSINHFSRFSGINVRTLVAVYTVVLMAGCASTRLTTVTLRDGTTHQVEVVNDLYGLPVRFANDQIKVEDLGLTATVTPGKDDLEFVRILLAELKAKGQFVVIVTSPLDRSASATLEATGPGKISLTFFPKADYPLIWEGIDQPGVHWFPFHFVFEEKESKQSFEFMQWSQMDYRTWKYAVTKTKEMK